MRLKLYSLLLAVLFFRGEACADTPVNYIITSTPGFYFDGPEFKNAIGYSNGKHLLPVCEVNSDYYRLCSFGNLPSYYVKPKIKLEKSAVQSIPRLVRIFAFEGFFDLLYSDSDNPPAYLVDNSSDKLRITFFPLISRLEYTRYEKAWKWGDIKVLPQENSAVVIEVDAKAGCGIEFENLRKSILRIHIKSCINKNFKVAIDPGHGGNDKGACQKKICEADLALKLSLKVKEKLSQKQITSILTRESDTEVSLEDRVKIAENNNASLLLSLHFDKWEVSNYILNTPSGTGCYFFHQFLSGAARKFCSGSGIPGLPINHITQRSLFLLLSHSFPSVLVEVGNFADENDIKRILQPDFINQAADVLARRIVEINSAQNASGKQ